MEKHKITYMATYEVHELLKPVWMTVYGKFYCETEEEAINFAMATAANDTQATGRWSVSMHHQGKRFCYSRQVAYGCLTTSGITEVAI